MNVISKDLITHLADIHLKETRQAPDGFQVSMTQSAIAVNGRKAVPPGLIPPWSQARGVLRPFNFLLQIIPDFLDISASIAFHKPFQNNSGP